MTSLEERRAASDLRVSENIRRYGCHVISVADPERKEPSFTYSVGIFESTGQPEAIVFGVRPELGAFMVNEYNRQVRAGRKYVRGRLYSGFLRGFKIFVEPALKGRSEEFMFACDRYYEGNPYPAVQLVYPNIAGVWPWWKTADDWFRSNQPLLGRKRPDKP